MDPLYNIDKSHNLFEEFSNGDLAIGTKNLFFGVPLKSGAISKQLAILEEEAKCYFEDSNEILFFAVMNLIEFYNEHFKNPKNPVPTDWILELLSERLKSSNLVHTKKKLFYSAILVNLLAKNGSSVDQAKLLTSKLIGLNATDVTLAFSNFKKLPSKKTPSIKIQERKILSFIMFNNFLSIKRPDKKTEEKGYKAFLKVLQKAGENIKELHNYIDSSSFLKDYPIQVQSLDKIIIDDIIENTEETLFNAYKNEDLRLRIYLLFSFHIYADEIKNRSAKK